MREKQNSGETRRSYLKSASAALAGHVLAAAAPTKSKPPASARHEWTRYRLIAEDGTPKRLLRMLADVQEAREYRLSTRDGKLLDVEPVVQGTGVKSPAMRFLGFWLPETHLRDKEFVLEIVEVDGTRTKTTLPCGPVPPGDDMPLRLDRTGEWLRRHMLSRERLPAAADVAGFVPDMDRYLEQHRIVYERPAAVWSEGLILGNGTAGALVTGEQRKSQTVYLDRGDLFGAMPDGRPMGRFYGGRLDLRYQGRGEGFLQELSLSRAEVVTRDGDLTTVTRVCADRDVVEVELTWRGAAPFPIEVELSRPSIPMPMKDEKYNYSMGNSITRMHGNWTPSGDIDEEMRRAIGEAPHTELKVTLRDALAVIDHRLPNMSCAVCATVAGTPVQWKNTSEPKLARIGSNLTASPGQTVTILVALVSDREFKDPAAEGAALVARTRVDTKAAADAHHAWWKNYWQRSFVEIPDKLMENQWYFSAYHQACFGRGLQATSFFGMWHPLDWRCWLDNYTADVQPPMLFWGTFPSNHLELLLPYHNTYGRLLVEYLEHSPCGAVVPDHGFPEYAGGHICFGDNSHTGSNGWIAQNLWWDYLYTGDKELLANITYPMLAAFSDFSAWFLRKGDDGKYHCENSESPEQKYTDKDSIYDRANIERCFRSAIATAKMLNVDAARVKMWQEILDNLYDYPQDDTTLCETTYNKHPYRCHAAVMFPVVPTGTVEPGDAMWKKAGAAYDIMTNLIGHNPWGRHRTIPGHEGGVEPMAFNSSFLLAAAARLRGWKEFERIYYGMVVRLQLKRNGQMSIADIRHRPDMIHMSIAEGVSGQMCGLTEILLQNYTDHVRLFMAASPGGISRFSGLRAFGGFVLAGEFDGVQATRVVVHSLHGNALRLLNPWHGGKITVEPQARIAFVKLKDGAEAIELATEPGKTYKLHGPKGKASLPEPAVENRRGPREIRLRDGQDFDPVVVYFPQDRLHPQFSRGDRVYLGIPREETSAALPVDVRQVRHWLDSPDWRYRQTAVRLLWRVNTTEAHRILKELAEKDPYPIVRYAAQENPRDR